MWTMTTFLYEIDRHGMPNVYRRTMTDMREKLCKIAEQVSDTECCMRVYCDDTETYHAMKMYPRVEVVMKPLKEWPIYAKQDKFLSIVSRVNTPVFPQDFSHHYSMAVLSKIDALLETAALYPDHTHMWIDAGYRWTVKDLKEPNWSSLSKVYIPCKRFPFETKRRMFGGVWGGSARSLVQLKKSFEEVMPSLIDEGLPFTEESVMMRVYDKYPSLIFPVDLHSMGPFPQGTLFDMVRFMVKGDTHVMLRNHFSTIDIAVATVILVCIIALAMPK
jgi:hypothetical protein